MIVLNTILEPQSWTRIFCQLLSGFQTVPETAREYIDREMGKGRTLDEIFEGVATEPGIYDMQLRNEHGLRAIDVVFLDRALPDSLTFSRLAGLNPNKILAECFTIVMLPYLCSTGSLFSRTVLGSKMTLLQVFSMSGSSAITVPWAIAL